jgi:hypothetical protein
VGEPNLTGRFTVFGSINQMRTWSIGGFIVASILSAAAAQAVPVTIDFESFPAMPSYIQGTPVPPASRLSDQYVTTSGVQFRSTSPYIAVVPLGLGHATSGTHGFGGVSADLIDYGAPVTFTFFVPSNPAEPAVTDFVSLRGDFIAGGGVGTLHAFDFEGNEIGTAVADDTGGQTWAISVPGIHSVRWDGSSSPADAGIALDDFSFNPVQAIPEPAGLAALAASASLLPRKRRSHRSIAA